METTNESAPDIEEAVRNRYSLAARQVEGDLCCPVDYDPQFLEVIPEEVLKRDYGCGNPSQYLNAGETVLDLGSGAGKVCFIAAQIVGRRGEVFGVDCNAEMLALARKYQPVVAERLGYDNVRFFNGRIQDLQLDLDLLDRYLAQNPMATSQDWLHVEEYTRRLRQSEPLIRENSIDVVISNCVLNLVRPDDRPGLFREVFRVLKRGGRAVISDIVCDEDVPSRLRQDPQLWSGCLSGAFREDRLLEAFEEAGFYGVEILARQSEPWAVLEGIEFRSVTVRAFKGKEGPCLDGKHAVIYNGPWKAVIDDDGHKLLRGKRMAVCEKTFQIYTRDPYADSVTAIPPHTLIPPDEAPDFSCQGPSLRHPRETKMGAPADLTILPEGDCCGSTDGC